VVEVADAVADALKGAHAHVVKGVDVVSAAAAAALTVSPLCPNN
jgi:hypothetical protein